MTEIISTNNFYEHTFENGSFCVLLCDFHLIHFTLPRNVAILEGFCRPFHLVMSSTNVSFFFHFSLSLYFFFHYIYSDSQVGRRSFDNKAIVVLRLVEFDEMVVTKISYPGRRRSIIANYLCQRGLMFNGEWHLLSFCLRWYEDRKWHLGYDDKGWWNPWKVSSGMCNC